MYNMCQLLSTQLRNATFLPFSAFLDLRACCNFTAAAGSVWLLYFAHFMFPQGHVYSLGSTLSAALNFVIEPELEAELGEEIQRLLQQMQEENPEDRPLVQV